MESRGQNVLAHIRYPIILPFEVRNKIQSSCILLYQRLHITLVFLQLEIIIRRHLLFLNHALKLFQLVVKAGECRAFFLQFLPGFGVCGLGTSNKETNQ